MKKLLFLSGLLFLIKTSVLSQGVAINADNSDADASAILDVKSTTKGALFPRMTEVQRNAIASPAVGLTIYQIDGILGLYSYNGTNWVKTGVFSINGNNAYFQGGNIGIGTSSPTSNLHVAGTSFFDGVINTNQQWISGDGDNEGIFINNTGNVGIGTSSQLVRLSVNGRAYIKGNADAGSGDTFDPPFDLTIDDSDTGFEVPGDGQLGIYTSNQLQMFFTPGLTGIGTSNPQDRFAIGTNSEFRVSDNGNISRINNVPYTWPTSNSTGVLSNNGSGSLSWSTAITSASNGLTQSGSSVSWGGTLTSSRTINMGSNNINFVSTTGVFNIYLDNINSDFYVYDRNDVPSLMVDGVNGRVGIGTFNPAAQLHVAGNVQFDGNINTNNQWISGDGQNEGLYVADNGHVSIGSSNNSSTLNIQQATTGIGQEYALDIVKSGLSTDRVLWVRTFGDGGTYNLELFEGNAYKPGGGSWGVLSDRRLKKNILPLENALAKLSSLKPVNYEYIDPQKNHQLEGIQSGFIAQEVENVFPEWVEVNGDGYKTVTFRGFESLTVKSFQELQAIIASQNERIKSLEAGNQLLQEKALNNKIQIDNLKAQLEILIEKVSSGSTLLSPN